LMFNFMARILTSELYWFRPLAKHESGVSRTHMKPDKACHMHGLRKDRIEGVCAVLSLIYTSRSRTHLSSIQIPVQPAVNDTGLRSSNSLNSLLLQTQSHLSQNVIRYYREDLPASCNMGCSGRQIVSVFTFLCNTNLSVL